MTGFIMPATLDLAEYAAGQAGIVVLLEAAHYATVCSIIVAMILTYWAVRRRIVDGGKGGQESAACRHILLKRLSTDLSARFNRDYTGLNLERMWLFCVSSPAEKISQTERRIVCSNDSEGCV